MVPDDHVNSPLMVKLPVPARLLLSVRVVAVTSPAIVTVPPEMAALPRVTVSATFTVVLKVVVPVPSILAVALSRCVPPEKASVLPSATLNVPVCVPLFWRVRLPLLTLTVPVLVKGTLMVAVPVPVVRLKMPALLKVASPTNVPSV